jgi:hypothetical protein
MWTHDMILYLALWYTNIVLSHLYPTSTEDFQFFSPKSKVSDESSSHGSMKLSMEPESMRILLSVIACKA